MLLTGPAWYCRFWGGWRCRCWNASPENRGENLKRGGGGNWEHREDDEEESGVGDRERAGLDHAPNDGRADGRYTLQHRKNVCQSYACYVV